MLNNVVKPHSEASHSNHSMLRIEIVQSFLNALLTLNYLLPQ